MEQWAELRREHFVAGKSIKRLVRETGLSKNTVRRALRSEAPPSYRRTSKTGMLEPFKPEIHRLLGDDPKLTGVRVRELLEPLGCTVGKTVVDDYLREVRPLFSPPPRTFGRGVWRPGEVCQFDVWQPRDEIAVGHGQTRRGWVVIACLGYSRAGAGVLVFSKQTEDLLAGIAGCLARLDALPQTLLWDRQAGLHAHRGRPTDAFAAFCGQLRVGWRFCEPADPQAKGAVERLQDYVERNFEPGRRFANELDFQDQLDAWCVKANARTHQTLRERPIDRLAQERALMGSRPAVMPDVSRRWVTRISSDPYVRVDTNDYSLDPRLVGRRVEVRVDQQQIVAGVLDTGEVACRHQRVFAKHRTITAIDHARAHRDSRRHPQDQTVEIRPLARYDALIA
ncbi:MAG: IS21 family transposase [Solirubrobacteraceae bacterium]